MIELVAVSKAFGGAVPRRLFDGLTATFEAGEFAAIVGASGVGKSTLLNMIAGLERPDSGSVIVDGINFGRCDDDALTTLRRTRMGFVFQAFHILPWLSVAENVGLPLALLGRGGVEAQRTIAEALEEVGLADRGASRPPELSGGELQRVAIARALVHHPRIVLADEPTGNLDPVNARHVIAVLRDVVKARGAAAVLATHSRTAAESADRVYRLQPDGLVVVSPANIE